MTSGGRVGGNVAGGGGGRGGPGARRWVTVSALAVAHVVWGGCGGQLPAADPLWVALVHNDGSLTPIAREQDGVWDQPWPSPFRPTLRVDSAGVLRPLLGVRWEVGDEPWALPVEVSDSGLATLTAPLEWQYYEGAEAAGSVVARGLELARVQCLHTWVLVTDRAELPREIDYREVTGVAFSRSVEIVAEEDIPGLDGIREELGYVDGTGDKAPRYVWLGFYRVADAATILGVMNPVGYEGERFDVVEIEGGVGKVVVRASGGSC